MITENGSPLTSEPIYLAIGKLHRPHGVEGEILMEVLTDFPERIKRGSQVYIGETLQLTRIRSRREHVKGMLVAFYGIDTPEQVGLYRNQIVKVLSNQIQSLREGEYYHHELLGLRIVTDDGENLGVLTDIFETGANDIFVVRSEYGKEILLPVIPDVVLIIDTEEGEITVHLIPGLMDLF